MADVMLNEQHLKDIAYAIRDKKGINQGGEELPSCVVVKTPNVVDKNEHLGGYGDYVQTLTPVTIAGAHHLVMELTYQTESTVYDWIQVQPGIANDPSEITVEQRYGGVAKTTTTINIDGDSVTIFFQSDGSGSTYFGYYAEIRGYDENGNLLGGVSQPGETYRPCDMADAILSIATGSAPTGEIQIDENGDYDVTEYASAHVEVPVGVFPSGDFPISENGTYDIESYETVTVSVASSGGGGADIEPIVLTGDQSNACSNAFATFVIENFGDKVTTENLNSTTSMFNGSTLKLIPFALNYEWTTSRYYSAQQMFMECYYLEKAPQMVYFRPGYCYQMFEKCQNLRDVSGIENWDCSYLNNGYSPMRRLFANCQSLRSVPTEFLKKFYNWDSSSYNVHTYGMFYNCNHIDEIVGLGFHPDGHWNSNNFQDAFTYCYCLKRLTFKTYEDGTPIPVDWTNQTIDLSDSIGYHCNLSNTDWNYVEKRLFNSGRTLDKNIYNDETYAALKNDPDAFVIGNSWEGNNWYYSRYDKASALETIRSLPDTSAFGGNNTIKFKGEAGLKTDAGAINTLTADEIAIATAKGWTVEFV